MYWIQCYALYCVLINQNRCWVDPKCRVGFQLIITVVDHSSNSLHEQMNLEEITIFSVCYLYSKFDGLRPIRHISFSPSLIPWLLFLNNSFHLVHVRIVFTLFKQLNHQVVGIAESLKLLFNRRHKEKHSFVIFSFQFDTWKRDKYNLY